LALKVSTTQSSSSTTWIFKSVVGARVQLRAGIGFIARPIAVRAISFDHG